MKTLNAVRIVAVALLSVHAGIAVGCKRESGSPSSSLSGSVPADSAIAEAAALATLPIHFDTPLGSDLHLAGLSVTAQPDHRSWIITLHSKVLHMGSPRPPLWVHAYPQESSEYVSLDPTGRFSSADVGRVVRDGFLLKRAGAFNLYVGVTGADGSLGPAVGLGWVGVGDPDTPEYHAAYRFLQKADHTRATAMVEQTRHDYPNAKLP